MPAYKNRKCYFCEEQIVDIDYKNTALLQKYLSQYKKIVPRYYSGTCLKHQKKLSNAVKNARTIALIPFTLQ
jgi:small subunit ribosomal protein S18